MKKIFTLLTFCSSFLYFSSVNAANFERDSILSLDPILSGTEILHVKITPVSIDSDIIDAGFALGTDSINAWGDYSCYVRFSNYNKDPYIDARNGGGMELSEGDSVPFEMGLEYDIWIELDVVANTYNVYVQSPDDTDPVLIASNFAFRKTPVTDLKFFACLHNGDESTSVIKVTEVEVTDVIGNQTSVPSTPDNNIKLKIYPNPICDSSTLNYRLNENSNVRLEVCDLNGRLISNIVSGLQAAGDYSYALSTDNLSKGVYFCTLKTNNQTYTQKIVVQ